MKQKVIVILLLSLWILQSTISTLLFELERSAHHTIVFNELTKNTTLHQHKTTIVFNNASEINWEIEGKEFKLNQVLYDVISIIENNGKIIINCKSDKKEDSIIKKNKTEKTTHKKNTQKKLISISFPEIDHYHLIPFSKTNSCFYAPIQFLNERIYLPVISPPPELCTI